MNGMTGSLHITQLMDWLEGRLTEAEREAVMAAIQADESNQADLAWLRDFLKFSESTVLMEPPAELVEQAVENFREFARGKQPPGWLQKLVATLTFDSWQRPSLAGVRRTGLDAAPRQLVYQTDAADVILNIHTGSEEALFDMAGQVFPEHETDPASFTVQLMLGSQEFEAALTYTNDIGKFTCANLASGTYTIIVRGDQVEITIADIELST
jgi:hypothetical protein